MPGWNVKYKPVSSEAKDEATAVPKATFNPVCIWSSLLTAGLISAYFVPSIGLTFFQRWFLKNFHFPLTVIICHLVIKFVLAALIRSVLSFCRQQPKIYMTWKTYFKAVVPTGVASGFDVGFSNWGLEFVTVSLYTMTKSTTIVFILGCAILFKLEKKSWSLCTIVIMISSGLVMFTYQSSQFDLEGFLLILFASFCSGLRWTCAQMLLQKSKLGISNPIDMIYHVQPWMIVSILPFAIYFEGIPALDNCALYRSADKEFAISTTYKVIVGAFIAFFMELCEFLVVTYTSSLTLSIAGIFKEMLILVLAVEWNGDQLSTVNLMGLLLCLGGIATHIGHKIRSGPALVPQKSRLEETDRFEFGEPLMKEAISEEPSEEDVDSQEIFNILNRRNS